MNRPLRITLQVVGFLVGCAILVWCVREALKPENREAFETLREAPKSSLAGLIVLSLLTLMINGLAFWAALLPIQRIPLGRTLAVNGLATFLAYLPFKISAIARVAIHHKRDQVPLITIGAWFAAMMGIVTISVGPPAGLAIALQRTDVVWLVGSLAGILILGGIVIGVSRRLAGARGIALVDRICARIPGLRSPRVRTAAERANGAFVILADWRTVVIGVLLRLADLGVHGARFYLAARMVGQPIGVSTAALAGATFYLIGAAAPSGMLGVREGGATWITGVAAGVVYGSAAGLAPAALVVGGVDLIVNLLGGAIGLAVLGPSALKLVIPSRTPTVRP